MDFWKNVPLVGDALNKALDGPLVRGAISKNIERYAELLSLRCAEEGGISAVLRLKGFEEEVQVRVDRIEFSADGSSFKVMRAWASKEGIQAFLDDYLVDKREFSIPQRYRPIAELAKKFFA